MSNCDLGGGDRGSVPETEGLIGGDAEVDLTTEGETLHGSLLEYVSRPTAELLSQFDPEDIDTTVRTLQAITERATEGLVVS